MDALVRLSQFRVERLTSMSRMETDRFRQSRPHTQRPVVVSLQFQLHRAHQVVVGVTRAVPTVPPAPNGEIAALWVQHRHHVKLMVAYGAHPRNRVTRGVFTKLLLRPNRQLQGLLLAMFLTVVR